MVYSQPAVNPIEIVPNLHILLSPQVDKTATWKIENILYGKIPVEPLHGPLFIRTTVKERTFLYKREVFIRLYNKYPARQQLFFKLPILHYPNDNRRSRVHSSLKKCLISEPSRSPATQRIPAIHLNLNAKKIKCPEL